MKTDRRIILGISGASGIIYGIRMLETLRDSGIYTHLVMSRAAQLTLACETDYSADDLYRMAGEVHPVGDLSASIASGSFKSMGMIIAPCSMKSLAEIATGISSTLLTRAADVMLKERRRLVLMARETPLHSIHLRNMLTLSDMGAIIAPPSPAFYQQPASVDDIVNHSVGRVLDLFDIDTSLVKRWNGKQAAKK